MEMTPEDYFNKEIEFRKESNKAQDTIDTIKREIDALLDKKEKVIVSAKEEINTINSQIRTKEDEIRGWRKVVRKNNTLADENKMQGFAARRLG